MRTLAAVLLAAALPLCAAADDLTVSSRTIPAKPAAPMYRLGYSDPGTPHGRASVGIGAGMKEGKPLEVAVWGGSGAVIGSVVAGPFGAMAGAAAGAVAGLVYSVFVVPRNGPTPGAGTQAPL